MPLFQIFVLAGIVLLAIDILTAPKATTTQL
jgi:hypothetical protein